MNVASAQAVTRVAVGLMSVALALATIVALMPRPKPAPTRAWQPPTGYAIVDTVPLDDGHTLRLWTGPSGWYVERVTAGRHEAAVGAMGDGGIAARYSVSEVLGGFVGRVPTASADRVSIRSHDDAVSRGVVHGVFLVPASLATAAEPTLLVTAFDASGTPLTPETSVPIAGRT